MILLFKFSCRSHYWPHPIDI